MSLASVLPWLLSVLVLQAASLPDTLIARTIPDRGVLEWTSGILQIVVLLLAVGALIALILLLVAMREGVRKLNATVATLSTETRPLLANASAMAGDARAMVAMVKQDVARVSHAAGAIGDELRYAAETTAQRVDDVNAVLDVLQDELEDTAISAVSALRGARLGAHAMASRLPGRRPKRSRRPDADADDA